MKPVHCITKHDPPNSFGDCVRACVASIMELPADAVPHFFHDDCSGETANDRMADWLGARGYVPCFAGIPEILDRPNWWQRLLRREPEKVRLSDVLEYMGMRNPNVHYMLFGRTQAGNHVVICRGGEIVHDPAWIPSSIVGPGSNGIWSIMVVALA